MRSLVSALRSGATSLTLAALLAATQADCALAGPFTRLQVLLPGETAAPGTPTGKSGTPRAQTVGVPFTLTVNACDDTWTRVTSVTHSVQVLSSDASASLPAPAQLVSGAGTFSATLNATGSFTMFVHDQTDNTIPDGTSASVQTLVLQGFVFSTISQKHFTAGVPTTMTLRAVDPQGNTVTGFSGVVRLKETTSFGDGGVSPDSLGSAEAGSVITPLPASTRSSSPCSLQSAARSAMSGCSTKPRSAKLEACTRITAAVRGVIAAA